MGETQEKVTRVLFCGITFPVCHLYTIEYLSKYPTIQVDALPLHEVPDVIGNYQICVPGVMLIDSDVISRAKKLKLIVQFGVGLDGVDVNTATQHGIKVARIPGKSAASCAEMTIYLILALLRGQKEMDISVKLKRLGDPCGVNLFGKTVFIMGYGNIGYECAKRLRPFDVRILATKRSWSSSVPLSSSSTRNSNDDDFVDEKGSHGDIYKFAGIADIVICCLAMGYDTADVVDTSFIQSMKKGAYLVNVARGGLMDYDAVTNGIKSGQLGGLGFDAAWTEPFDPNDPILQFPNVIYTPHVAGITEHTIRTLAKVVGDVALQFHQGNAMTGIEFVN